MKLLVTGAQGFTGKHFVNAATKYGHEVFVLKTNLKDKENLTTEVLEINPELVVHLAAISFVGHNNLTDFYDVNVLGTTNLLEALTKLKNVPFRVLLASSANVYGNCENSPINEEQPVSLLNHYAMSKYAMECMARNYLDKLHIFFVRPFNYIGPGQANEFIIPKLIDHFVRREDEIELGNLKVEREFNDVRFVCDAYLKLLKNADIGQIYNVCSGKPIALTSILQILKEITGHEIKTKMNNLFLRKNDIQSLCGCPVKLAETVGDIEKPSFEETLNWIYEFRKHEYFF